MGKRRKEKCLTLIAVVAAILSLTACSTQKNTSASRWWHAFNARYNTYFNGSQAFIEGAQEKEDGHHDNFTEQLPLYPAGTKNGKDIGKEKFDRAIEKAEKAIKRHSIKRRPQWTKNRRKTKRDIEWLGRKEYNPFIWKAWLLLGKSQFQKGEFEEAAATFAYMSRLYATQPAISGISRAWLTKSYAELGWLYEAEDVMTKMRRDSMDYRAVTDWDYAYCDYYLHSGNRKEAIRYLKKVIGHERRRKQRARQWYLLGQLEAAEGNSAAADKAFRKVIRMSPPYELSFNARIALTEVTAKGKSKTMISRLKRMASSDNNKDYLEQVYYAIGNIYLAQHDTIKAISAYEEGNRKATRNGIEKGVLLLNLGNLYWTRKDYANAQRCYNEAIGLLDKDRGDYDQLSRRSVMLDHLVPHVEAIHLQDSLLYLAQAPETERIAAIDRQIALLKKQEKEAREAALDQEAETLQQQNNEGQAANAIKPSSVTPKADAALWYFYNPTAVAQGKAAFERLWGRRENIDNWRRANQTVVKFDGGEDEALPDSTSLQETEDTASPAATDERGQQQTKDTDDPHQRAYYLAQIPLTKEKKAEAEEKLKEALLAAGIVMKDEMDDIEESRTHLERLSNTWQDFRRDDETCYHLFLIYLRKGEGQKADQMVARLKERHPESQYTKLLSNPYYIEDARWGEHIEDSIYTATYEAFKQGKNDVVKANLSISDRRFEQGDNRPRFLYIGALALLNDGDAEGCIRRMTEVVEKHPKSEMAEMAGMIVKGVRQGRKLNGGGGDAGEIWDRRNSLEQRDTTNADTLCLNTDQPHVVMLAFRTDSVNSNQLLYELAKHNFTNYLVRNFEIKVEDIEGITRMTVSGFLNYDEASLYRRQLVTSFTPIQSQGSGIRLYIVSEANLRLLGTTFSYADYEQYFNENIAPTETPRELLLDEPAEVVVKEQGEQEGDTSDDGDEEETEDSFDFDEDFYR